jgi:protoporphyrinogen/coproporphyrinogen III oxidase
MTELIEGLMNAVPQQSVRCGSNVTVIEERDGFTIQVAHQPSVHARAIILAIPAFAAAGLMRPLDAELSTACGSIRHLSSATVVFAFPRAAIRHNLKGTGFVVPRAEGISITAGAWISSKWPNRAPEGQALLRAFLGGARDPDVLSKTDAELASAALGDLAAILGIRGAPILTRVYRWNRSSPQLEVGHGELMRRIDGRLLDHPGLFVSAAGFRGVGIPDSIADARHTAGAAAAFLQR